MLLWCNCPVWDVSAVNMTLNSIFLPQFLHNSVMMSVRLLSDSSQPLTHCLLAYVLSYSILVELSLAHHLLSLSSGKIQNKQYNNLQISYFQLHNGGK